MNYLVKMNANEDDTHMESDTCEPVKFQEEALDLAIQSVGQCVDESVKKSTALIEKNVRELIQCEFHIVELKLENLNECIMKA